MLPLSQVAKYRDKYDEVKSKVKEKKHKDSIETADQIISKKTTYEAQCKLLAQKRAMNKMVAKTKSMIPRHSTDEEHSERHVPKTRR
jgi:hypothetical protein